MSKINHQSIEKELENVQKQLKAYGDGEQDIIDCKELWNQLETAKEKLKSSRSSTKRITIQYDTVVGDVISSMEVQDVVKLWQDQNFDQGLADAQFATSTERKNFDVHIYVMDGKKILNTIIV